MLTIPPTRPSLSAAQEPTRESSREAPKRPDQRATWPPPRCSLLGLTFSRNASPPPRPAPRPESDVWLESPPTKLVREKRPMQAFPGNSILAHRSCAAVTRPQERISRPQPGGGQGQGHHPTASRRLPRRPPPPSLSRTGLLETRELGAGGFWALVPELSQILFLGPGSRFFTAEKLEIGYLCSLAGSRAH